MNKIVIKQFHRIPVQMPKQRILARLGFNKHLTRLNTLQESKIVDAMNEAFQLCHPMGCWCRIPIASHDGSTVCLENGAAFASQDLAALLEPCHAVVLFAATVGADIMKAIEECSQYDGARTAVFDAVASESADAALGWIHEYLATQSIRCMERVTTKRFSPGYGDLALTNQRIIFDLLELEHVGLTLTERLMLIPEKSVIAIAGIAKA